MTSRKLFRILPFEGVDVSGSKLEAVTNANGDISYCRFENDVDSLIPVFSVHESDVDKFIELGILREELPKWADDRLIAEFFLYLDKNFGTTDDYTDRDIEAYLNHNKDILAKFKELKGIK